MGDIPDLDQARIAWEAQQDSEAKHGLVVAKIARSFYRQDGWTVVAAASKEVVNTVALQERIEKYILAAVVADPAEVSANGIARPQGMAELFPSLPKHDSQAWHALDSDHQAAWREVAAEVWRMFGNAGSKHAAAEEGYTLIKTGESKDSVGRVFVTANEQIILEGPVKAIRAKAVRAQEKASKELGAIAMRHQGMLPALERTHKGMLRDGKKGAQKEFDTVKELVAENV
jgi:hypothetical protein